MSEQIDPFDWREFQDARRIALGLPEGTVSEFKQWLAYRKAWRESDYAKLYDAARDEYERNFRRNLKVKQPS